MNWIIWSPSTDVAVIIIPEEAEILLPLFARAQLPPATRLLTYAAPLTRQMLHFNKLQYYAVPSLPTDWEAPGWLRTELEIFAGRLYFEYEEYNALCQYIGTETPADMQLQIRNGSSREESDDTGSAQSSTSVSATKLFATKPLAFLHEWLAIRRKGQDFENTPMGLICQGRPLLESHRCFTSGHKQEKDELQPSHTIEEICTTVARSDEWGS